MASPAERVNVAESEAKLLYGIWAHRTGSTIAWERLPLEQQTAWREIFEYTADNPTCAGCGEAMLCLSCDEKAVRESLRAQTEPDPVCEVCGDDMLCVHCDAKKVRESLAEEGQTATEGS